MSLIQDLEANAMQLPIPEPLEGDVEFTDDSRAVVLRHISKAMDSLHTLSEVIKMGQVSRDITHTALALVEHAVADISKTTGVPTQTEADLEQRHERVRSANLRVRELERQLGTAVTPDAFVQSVRRVGTTLDKWWDDCGFGHISDIKITKDGGCVLELSGMLFGRFSVLQSKTPVSDKQQRAEWLQGLKDQGFVLDEVNRRADAVVDCDASRKQLENIIYAAFPTARILGYSAKSSSTGVMHIHSVEVYLRSLQEVFDLAEQHC